MSVRREKIDYLHSKHSLSTSESLRQLVALVKPTAFILSYHLSYEQFNTIQDIHFCISSNSNMLEWFSMVIETKGTKLKLMNAYVNVMNSMIFKKMSSISMGICSYSGNPGYKNEKQKNPSAMTFRANKGWFFLENRYSVNPRIDLFAHSPFCVSCLDIGIETLKIHKNH